MKWYFSSELTDRQRQGVVESPKLTGQRSIDTGLATKDLRYRSSAQTTTKPVMHSEQPRVKPLELHREHKTQQEALNYSNLNERVNILERQLFEEKRLRLELEDNFWRNPLLLQNQNSNMELLRGKNQNINDFLKRSKD